ncbi:hypothetical protein ABEB36_002820 [Hypothenemus hampei]|uniref:Uncharacterized protein n=1 Tax=Hypothenemus hampei TaxID=57062 RepID=A0ABD1F730_HYPHA
MSLQMERRDQSDSQPKLYDNQKMYVCEKRNFFPKNLRVFCEGKQAYKTRLTGFINMYETRLLSVDTSNHQIGVKGNLIDMNEGSITFDDHTSMIYDPHRSSGSYNAEDIQGVSLEHVYRACPKDLSGIMSFIEAICMTGD